LLAAKKTPVNTPLDLSVDNTPQIPETNRNLTLNSPTNDYSTTLAALGRGHNPYGDTPNEFASLVLKMQEIYIHTFKHGWTIYEGVNDDHDPLLVKEAIDMMPTAESDPRYRAAFMAWAGFDPITDPLRTGIQPMDSVINVKRNTMAETFIALKDFNIDDILGITVEEAPASTPRPSMLAMLKNLVGFKKYHKYDDIQGHNLFDRRPADKIRDWYALHYPLFVIARDRYLRAVDEYKEYEHNDMQPILCNRSGRVVEVPREVPLLVHPLIRDKEWIKNERYQRPMHPASVSVESKLYFLTDSYC
jgi:hypothetical protein